MATTPPCPSQPCRRPKLPAPAGGLPLALTARTRRRDQGGSRAVTTVPQFLLPPLQKLKLVVRTAGGLQRFQTQAACFGEGSGFAAQAGTGRGQRDSREDRRAPSFPCPRACQSCLDNDQAVTRRTANGVSRLDLVAWNRCITTWFDEPRLAANLSARWPRNSDARPLPLNQAGMGSSRSSPTECLGEMNAPGTVKSRSPTSRSHRLQRCRLCAFSRASGHDVRAQMGHRGVEQVGERGVLVGEPGLVRGQGEG